MKNRALLPIRCAAIDLGKNVCLVEDKLTIDSKLYMMDNLHELPTDLSPEKLATKTIDKHTFFFSAATPLSNFHTITFEIDGIVYNFGEMYIQASKAKLFRDDVTLKKIMNSKTPGEMKVLGTRISNFNADCWAQAAPKIANKCYHAKFS